MSLAAALVSDLEEEAVKTRKLLAVVPEGRMDWKPHEKSMSLGQLVGHVAENPAWIPAMLEDEMDFAELMKDYRPFAPRDRSEALEALERNVRTASEAVRGRDDGLLEGTWTARMGDKVLMSLPKHKAIRETGIHHWVHHRGQLTVYLRLLDVPLPGLYGPTADQASFS